MRVQVTLKQINLDTGEEKVIADGPAIMEKGRLRYREDREKAIHDVHFSEEEVILERRADISSRTVLTNGKQSQSTVKSPWGDMNLQAKTNLIQMEKERWIVEYELFSENERILNQRLQWEIRYLS